MTTTTNGTPRKSPAPSTTPAVGAEDDDPIFTPTRLFQILRKHILLFTILRALKAYEDSVRESEPEV